MSGFLSVIIPPAGDRVANFRSTNFQATLVPHSQYVHAVKNLFAIASRNNFTAVGSPLRARHINRPLAARIAVIASGRCRGRNDCPRLEEKLSRDAHNRPNVEMTFQRVPACTQLERLGKSGDKVVVCRLSRSLGRDS